MDPSALIQPKPATETDRRLVVRRASSQEAVSRPLDAQDTLSWGAQVRDVSAAGIGLTICYPFKPGSYLAIELQRGTSLPRTYLVRVVHVQDQSDGTWAIGCEFVKHLTPSDVELPL